MLQYDVVLRGGDPLNWGSLAFCVSQLSALRSIPKCSQVLFLLAEVIALTTGKQLAWILGIHF